MKSVVSFLIGVFVLLASAVPAEAQGLPPRQRVGDIVGDVIGDDLQRWRDRQQERRPYYGRENDRRYRNDNRREEAWDSWNRRPYRGDYVYEYPYQGEYRGSWGRVIREAGGDPYFDALVVPCKTVSERSRWKKGIAITGLGAIIGGLIGSHYDRPGAGILAGAGAGGAVALLNDSELCSPSERVRLPIQPPVVTQPGGSASVPTSVPTNVVRTDVPTIPNGNRGPAYRPGPHPLANNETQFIVDVYDGNDKAENFVGTMQAGESWDLARPRNRYRGWAQTPNKKGSFDSNELDARPNANGWTFVE